MAFNPRYVSIGTCNSIDVQCCKKDNKQSHVRVKRVPKEHVALREFCERVQEKLKLKLFYKGDSAAVVGHNFVQLLLVKRRELITTQQERQLWEDQDGKCAKCRDALRRWEVHHKTPMADGGSSSDTCLLCVSCHGEETELQELRGSGNKVPFESQLSPQMMDMFETVPRPLQLRWGDAGARARAMAADDFTPLTCLDVIGCRKNALLSRPTLPVGSPLDCVERVFNDDDTHTLPWHKWAYMWVDADVKHALYDGPICIPEKRYKC